MNLILQDVLVMSFSRKLVHRVYVKAKDKFLKLTNPRLSHAFSIQSHLTTEERVMLYQLALGKTNGIEIGSYIGASACCFGSAMKRSGFGRLFCIDTWRNDAMSEGSRDTYGEFLKNTKLFSEYIVPVRGYSIKVVENIAFRTNDVDLLFIDGDHSYEGVKSDWKAYRRFLKTNSVVILHDWGWADGVKKVINEEIAPAVGIKGELPNMWWGIIKV